MRSGNDAAVALANYTAGSVENFADMMNKKAQELGLINTHFVTPHGLDNPNHYTTAYELAKLADYALKNSVFATIVKTKYVTIKINNQPKELKNTNELLLGDIEGVYGVKTGFTGNAGRCLVTSVKRNNMDLIIVVLGADTRKDRAKDTLKLIDYAFKEFKMKSIEETAQEEYELWKNANENRIAINKGTSKLKTKLGNIQIKQIATNKELSAEIHNINYLEAPVEAGSKIGEIIIKNGDTIIDQYPINSKVTKDEKVFLFTNSTNKTIPNLIGYSRSDVEILLHYLNINYSISGYGYVVSQNLGEGTEVGEDTKLELQLDSKIKKE